MGQNFLACDRDQVLLLPPDLRDWLPEDHLAWFVLGTVQQLDLEAVYAYYRVDGRGRPAHDPAMMVTLVLYAYAVGVTSSRAIERRCVDDVAFRVIAADRRPDHATIARFLIRHRDGLSGLFFQMLSLCQRAGMVQVGTVAVDSTKLAANASAGESRTLAGLRAEAERIIEDAIATDAQEDALYGEKRGDELPDELADPRTRKARIKQLLEEAEAELAAAEQARADAIAADEQQVAETGKRKRGRPRKLTNSVNHEQRALLSKKYNLTDPDSAIVRHRGMSLQGYNIQTTVAAGQVILAAEAVGNAADTGQLAPAVARAQENLRRIDHHESIQEVLADTGYWNIRQVRDLTDDGIDVLLPPAARKITTGQHVSPETTTMLNRLQQPDIKRRYLRRQQIIEPVFAHIKHHRKITRLWRRGQTAVQAEITLIATTHNLLKLYTSASPA